MGIRAAVNPGGPSGSVHSLDLKPGAEPVAGFQLVTPLGRGGFGQVWKANGPGGFQVAMKFVFLIYHDEQTLDSLPDGERQRLVDAALGYMEELRQSGHFIVSNALQRGRTARTIRVRGGGVSTTDGPFAETKEQIGGYFIVDCKDLDEAIEVASKIPGARHGAIEVRPIWEM